MAFLGLELYSWLLLFVLLALLYWNGTKTYNTFQKLGIPYMKPKLPYLGHVMNILFKSIIEEDMMRRAEFPGKIYGQFRGRRPQLCVADVEVLKEITIKQLQNFRNHESLLEGEDNIHTRHVGAVMDEHWKHVRSILTPTFTSGKLKLMFPVIKNCADKLVSHLKSTNSEPVDIKEGLTVSRE
ncbi:CYP3A4 [Bugula neritina]|uniref:CYP3A4 n=1 Tax=Bugula neritina TaxID=10212 RepID=A0A7J7JB04_BUGNE|nr:CYP3A4 [Bugula neritina]